MSPSSEMISSFLSLRASRDLAAMSGLISWLNRWTENSCTQVGCLCVAIIFKGLPTEQLIMHMCRDNSVLFVLVQDQLYSKLYMYRARLLFSKLYRMECPKLYLYRISCVLNFNIGILNCAYVLNWTCSESTVIWTLTLLFWIVPIQGQLCL